MSGETGGTDWDADVCSTCDGLIGAHRLGCPEAAGDIDEPGEPAGWFNPRNDYHGYQQVAKEFEGGPDVIPLYHLSALTSLRAERDALIKELPGTFKWELLKERNEARSSLAAEKLKVEELTSELAAMRASRDGLADEINAAQFKKDRDQQRVAALVGALDHVHNWIANSYFGPDELAEVQTLDNIVLEAINYVEQPFAPALATEA